MSYIVIKVYSFECDHGGCEEIIEAQRPSLPEAKDEIKTKGWRVLPRNVCLCPGHSSAAAALLSNRTTCIGTGRHP